MSVDVIEEVPGLPNFLNRNRLSNGWSKYVAQTIGDREQQLRQQREAEAKTKPKASAPAKPPAPPATKETTVTSTSTETTAAPKKIMLPKTKKAAAKAKAKATKAAAPTKAPKPAAKKDAPAALSARPDGLREGSKQAVMLDMALLDEGATEATICKKLGWKKCRVTLKRVCEKVGAKLESKKNPAGETVFFATMPKAKA